MLVFIDGSGDLGLAERHIESKSSSTYHCLGVIVSRIDYDKIENQLSESKGRYEKGYSQRLPQELKYTKMNEVARKYFCGFLKKASFEMYVLILNKRDMTGKVAKWEKAGIAGPIILRELLKLLLETLFIDPEYKLNLDEKIDVYFDENIHTSYSNMLERQVRKISNKITIHKAQDSRRNIGIQLADILAGSCFHYLNGEKVPFEMIIKSCKLSEISLQEEMGFYKLTHSKFIIK